MAIGLKYPVSPDPIEGIKLASVAADIRYHDRDDLVLVWLPETASTAAVFTKNRFCAAPVEVSKEHLLASQPRALLINAGNANAGTGLVGVRDARTSCELVGNALGVPAESVLPFSTGVIGELLPMDKVAMGIVSAAAKLDPLGWLPAASAIMTTDTVPKVISRSIDIAGYQLTLTGMVKGSGMIRPDMATLLVFAAIDACVPKGLLQDMLQVAVDASFNRITVDGDTSTNDSCVLIANGRVGALTVDGKNDPSYEFLLDALCELMIELAQQTIRDGEGATKFVEVRVSGASSESDCREIAYTVGHSPLVKTALFSSDPNWGRILAAVGRANVSDLDMSNVGLTINNVSIISAGQPDPGYSESRGKIAMEAEDILIDISLGHAATSFTLWTTDLSHDYVTINADYRT
jgi:glutamate N-acetyltransferase/amino-acid N-acetyltransferase